MKHSTVQSLTKSPLKPTRFGKMFTMSLCQDDPTSTIRAICFEENMFGQFNTKESYDLQFNNQVMLTTASE